MVENSCTGPFIVDAANPMCVFADKACHPQNSARAAQFVIRLNDNTVGDGAYKLVEAAEGEVVCVSSVRGWIRASAPISGNTPIGAITFSYGPGVALPSNSLETGIVQLPAVSHVCEWDEVRAVGNDQTCWEVAYNIESASGCPAILPPGQSFSINLLGSNAIPTEVVSYAVTANFCRRRVGCGIN